MGADAQPKTDTRSNGELPRDDHFDVLSSHRRRYTLYYLMENGNEATLRELADTVAAWENDVHPDAVSYDQRKRVYTALQQVHLPRMDEMDVVDFDDREGAVALGPAAEGLDSYLKVAEGRGIPWSLCYLLLALVDSLLIGGAVLGLPLLAAVPLPAWAVFVVGTFLVTSLAHAWLTHVEGLLGGGNPRPPGSDSGT